MPIIPLHASRAPDREVLHEQPQHRQMILLRAQGLSCKQIADSMDVNIGTVSNLIRQPWAEEILLQLQHAHSEGQIEKLLNHFAKEALDETLNLMRNSENERVRAQAAFKVLDLAVGQKVKIEQGGSLETLQDEIARTEKEIALLTQKSN